MSGTCRSFRVRGRRSELRSALRSWAVPAIVLGLAASCWAQPGAYPVPEYFLAIQSYYNGQYDDSLRGFRAAARGGVRSTAGRWIDSICYHAMMGESSYQMGQLPAALEQFEAALNLYLAHQDWMLRVRYTDAIRPARRRFAPVTWGVSARRSVPGAFPDTMHSFQGRLNNDQALQRGGVVTPPKLVAIHVHEIVRCTTLALRRRMQLLGPIGPHEPRTDQLVQALSGRRAPVNHWSQSWVRVQLGMALASSGRVAEAIAELESSLLIGGQFDHPLTATALLELGKLALQQDRPDAAATYFLEATIAAAMFQQPDVMDEAFRYGLRTHLTTHPDSVYSVLAPAAQWAREQRYVQLQASLLICAAENYAALRQPTQAARLLEEARRVIGRRSMVAGSCRWTHTPVKR